MIKGTRRLKKKGRGFPFTIAVSVLYAQPSDPEVALVGYQTGSTI
jgi:hypothetical protein